MKKILTLCFLFMVFSGNLFAEGRQEAAKEPVTLNGIGTWADVELDNFKAVCQTAGITLNFESTRDLDAILTTRAATGNLPDFAVLPNPMKLKEMARKGQLKELSFLDKKALLSEYAKSWIDLGSYGGKLYGIFFKTGNKSVIWYSPKQFAKNGWAIPKTWDELVALTQKIKASGKTPWSIGADIGWPLSDWIENIMIRTAGPDLYQKWIDHEIPWTHPAVKNAFLKWGEIVGDPKNLLGGIDGTLAAKFQNAAYAVFQTSPRAYMYYEGDFMGGIVTSELKYVKLGEDMAFFPFPPIDPKYGTPVVGGADVIVIFNDSPAVQRLIKYLTTSQAHEIWVKRGGFLSHNKKVSLASYPDETMRASAQILTSADIFVFDASDLMPSAVGNQGGFWDACKKFLQNRGNLDAVLAEMEKLAKKNY